MPKYTVSEVSPGVRDWSGAKAPVVEGVKQKDMRSYRVELRDEQGQITQKVEWAKRITSDPPKVGESVEGDLEDRGEYGHKLKVASGGGAYRGGGGQKGPWPEDPVKAAGIGRMHAQEHAIRLIDLALRQGLLANPPTNSEELFALLGQAIDYLDRDVNKVREAAQQTASAQNPQ
jgi:hypothetical protein